MCEKYSPSLTCAQPSGIHLLRDRRFLDMLWLGGTTKELSIITRDGLAEIAGPAHLPYIVMIHLQGNP